MILTKKDLHSYLKIDKEAQGLTGKSFWKDLLLGNFKEWYIWNLTKKLRHFEYAKNTYENKHSFFHFLRYIIKKRSYSTLQLKTGIYISPNVFGPGINIVHPGYIWASSTSKIGKNCTILPRVLLGKKRSGLPQPCIIIGDDCYIGTGATILGPISIGNNVTIAAGAVVVKDVPDNCIVAGNPAKVIKIKEIEEKGKNA